MPIELKHTYAATPRTSRGDPVHLGGDPKGENFLYCCGSSVVIRNIKNPLIAELYNDHTTTTTVAKYAPSGFYIASGDSQGSIRIWDTTQKEHLAKLEVRPIAGPIWDLAWSADSQRIVLAGEGRERFGACISWDTGNNVGEIVGHSKTIRSCDFKPSRPFRIITGGEDQTVQQYEGPPFKYKLTQKDHTRFVNCVRYSPSGDQYVTVGSDMKGFLYDAKTGDKVAELGAADAHTGGIFSASWSPDNSKVLTASADRTCKIWDVATQKCISTFTMADQPTVDHQQVGCLWQGEYLLSVGLNGYIYYLDQNNPSKPTQVLKGHNKFITALAVNSSKKEIYSGSYDGIVHRWTESVGITEGFTGQCHQNEVTSMACEEGSGTLYSGGKDDCVRTTDLGANAHGSATSTEGPVQGLDVPHKDSTGLVVASTLDKLQVIRSGKLVSSLKVDFRPSCVAVSPDAIEVAVGSLDDNSIHTFELGGDTLKSTGKLEHHRGTVSALAYAPNGEFLAAGDANREIVVWDRKGRSVKISGWVFHTARINSLAWAPDSQFLASASLDQGIIVWNVNSKTSRQHFKGAHKGGVNKVVFFDQKTLVSGGQDCSVKTWTVDC